MVQLQFQLSPYPVSIVPFLVPFPVPHEQGPEHVTVATFGPVPTLQVQAVRSTLEVGELEPVGHATHVVETVAPTVAEYFPVPHSVHAPEPDAVLYFPATHAAIELPCPVYPALPTQAELEAGEIEFVGQFVHVASAVAASDTENLPAAQLVHA